MILSEFTGDRRPRTQIRPKLIAKTSKKAEKGACRRPTKMHALTNIEIAVSDPISSILTSTPKIASVQIVADEL